MVKETGVYGASEATRGRHIRELVKPGDVLIFYVTKKGSKRLGDKFVGLMRSPRSGLERRSHCGQTRPARVESNTLGEPV